MRGKDGISRRFHLEKEAEGLVPNVAALAELEAEIPLPNITADLWIHYQQLDRRRSHNMEGEPLRFSWVDLQAYMEVTGVRLGRWYLKTIFALEDKYFQVRAENKS